MTDIELYFISDNKQNLLDNETNIENYIYSETAEAYTQNQIVLANNNITPINTEFLENTNELNNIQIIKKYSYRF
jgi:hypothetical protein